MALFRRGRYWPAFYDARNDPLTELMHDSTSSVAIFERSKGQLRSLRMLYIRHGGKCHHKILGRKQDCYFYKEKSNVVSLTIHVRKRVPLNGSEREKGGEGCLSLHLLTRNSTKSCNAARAALVKVNRVSRNTRDRGG